MKLAILEEALKDIPFDGWTSDVLRKAGQARVFQLMNWIFSFQKAPVICLKPGLTPQMHT